MAILTAYEKTPLPSSTPSTPRVPAPDPPIRASWCSGPTFGTYYILFTLHKDVSPAGKQLTVQEMSKARFAFGQLVQPSGLRRILTQAGQVAATGFFPNNLSDGLNADVRSAEGYGSWYTGTNTPSAENANYTEDQVAALKTLIELGYAYTGSIETGDIMFTDAPSIEFAFNNSGANAAIIQYVQEVWNTFGITATINTEAWSTLQTKLKAGDAEAARMGWIGGLQRHHQLPGHLHQPVRQQLSAPGPRCGRLHPVHRCDQGCRPRRLLGRERRSDLG